MRKKPQVLPPTKNKARRAPAHLYSKENPSPHAFKPGESGNLGGRGGAKDPYKLVSRAMRSRLNAPAPHDVARAAGLPPNASWAQVLGNTLVDMAIFHKDLAAARLVLEYCDAPMPRTAKLELSGPDGEMLQPPSLNIVVVDHKAPPQLQPVAKKLPVRSNYSGEMIPADASERAAAAVVAAVKKGNPCSVATINSCLPPGWVIGPNADTTGLEQAGGNAAHWEQIIRAGVVPV
jgi:hypothetical protein